MKKSLMSKDRHAAAFQYAIQHATGEKTHGVGMRCLANKALRHVVYCSTIFLSITSLCNAIEYKYIELLPPGWSQANAIDINDSGTVVGYGSDDTGTQKGFISVKVSIRS